MDTSIGYRARVQSPEPREVTEYYSSLQESSTQGPSKRSKFVHKIRAIRETSYMTELHTEKVITIHGAPRLRLEKIRVHKEF